MKNYIHDIYTTCYFMPEMLEKKQLKPPVLKTGNGATRSCVRISLSLPLLIKDIIFFQITIIYLELKKIFYHYLDEF